MSKTRRENLIKLRDFFNLETGQMDRSAFHEVDALFDKAIQKKALDTDIRNCRLCPGLNVPNMTEAAVGYGDLNAKIMFVGQSLCTVCMNTGIPFTKGSGYLIDAALILADLERKDVFITNIIHCHPPQNRASLPKEVANCRNHLLRELDIVKPELVVTLGADARDSFAKIKAGNYTVYNVKHPAAFLHGGFEGAIEWVLNLAKKLEKYK